MVLSKLLSEIGITTFLQCSTDVYLLIGIKFLRFFSYSAISLINAIYLKKIGYNESQIGLLFTIIMFGDVVTTFLISVFADKVLGRRKTLAISSLMMIMAGVYWFMFSDSLGFYPLCVVSAICIITAIGSDVGPFNSIEESSIAEIVPDKNRSDVFTWYSIISMFANALGFAFSGSFIGIGSDLFGWDEIETYKSVYLVYSICAVLILILSLLLSSEVEIDTFLIDGAYESLEDEEEEADIEQILEEVAPASETTALLSSTANDNELENQQQKRRKSDISNDQSPSNRNSLFWDNIIPQLSRSGWYIVINISILFALDSLASAISGKSWILYYFKQKFVTSTQELGQIFFWANLISSICSMFSTSICKRYGPIFTMVFTHLPSSILLLLISLPDSKLITFTMFLTRAITQTMDNAPKKVFLAAVIQPSERTVVLSWVKVVKTLVSIIGPSITGVLANYKNQALAFVLAGILKIIYDMGIFVAFYEIDKERHKNTLRNHSHSD